MVVKKAGIVLVHGWSGRPAEMAWLAGRLEKKAYLTRTVRLAGHDSSLAAFEAANWQGWARSVEDAFDSLAKRAGRVAIIGLSTGGTLGLHLAARRRRQPDALVCINAPIRRPRWRMAAAACLRHGLRWVDGGDRNIENLRVRAANPGFKKLPLRSVWQLDRLIGETRARLKDVSCPLLVVRSRMDGTIPAGDAALIDASVSSIAKASLVVSRGWHVATVDNGKEELLKNILPFLKQYLRT